MSLEKYAEKRDFTKTAEPKAGRSKDKDHLMFVIQKHDASRLHYDFRLEMDGVLKSWAVPKGPSLNPKEKHLAMMVEDHPFDYRNFEGIIPQGEYGGGTVIVWDQGTYEPIEEIKGKKAQEKHLLKQLASGSLKIKLHGEKLDGEFALVKTHGMGENAWLLIKHNDEFATDKDITKKDKSVLSGKTIPQMEKTGEKVWQHGHEEDVEKADKKSKKKALTKPDEVLSDENKESAIDDIDVEGLLKKAPKSKAPTGVKPMKATLVDEPFDDPDWVYEVKWDGYRAVGVINNGDAELISRNNIPFNERFYSIHNLLKKWKFSAVVDGEILVLNDKGISDFGALQNWRSEADGELVFYIFDILWYEGKNLMELSLIERQAILKQVIPTDDDRIRISQVFHASGIEFFNAASKMGLVPNGIHGSSFYQKDIKGKAPDWVTKTFPYTTSEGEHKEYLVGSDESYLLWMASLGCIEMNPWFSRIQSPDNPDYCVIDLDPDKNTFDQVIEAAQEVRKVLDAIDVPCFPKTSGSTGMHIYIPLEAKYTYDQSQLFARIIVGIVHKQIPDYTSLERMVANRKGKMYLDFLQNRPGATIAGPYSLRPKPGATVSMPVSWDEVKPGLTMKHFTIFNTVDRLKETGDLFKGVLGKGIDLEKTIKKAQSIFGK